jgi:hypothetical protein
MVACCADKVEIEMPKTKTKSLTIVVKFFIIDNVMRIIEIDA